MSWLILVLAGMLEAVWAIALGASHGFSRWRPTVLFGLAFLGSMGGLAWAMRELPAGTAYAVWVGIGATLTVLWGFLSRQERPTVLRGLLLAALITGIVGLKVVS